MTDAATPQEKAMSKKTEAATVDSCECKALKERADAVERRLLRIEQALGLSLEKGASEALKHAIDQL